MYIGNYKHAMETVMKCKNANQQFAAIMEQVKQRLHAKCQAQIVIVIVTARLSLCVSVRSEVYVESTLIRSGQPVVNIQAY